MSNFYKLWFVIALLVIVLVGCGTSDLEAQRDALATRKTKLRADVEKLRHGTTAEITRLESEISNLKSQIMKLGELLDPLPSPAPGPQPLPVPSPTPAPQPTPTPQPSPTPAPSPPALPDGKFAISNDVVNWVKTLVPAESRAAGLEHFIRGSESIAADCDNGTITGLTRYTLVMSIKDAIGKHNGTIPADVLISWKPFAAAFNAKANTLFSAGRLTTPAEWSTLLREVVIGLKAAK